MSDVLAYLTAMVASLVPWFELFVIPPAIALGLHPVGVALLVFAANSGATLAIVFGWERILNWWQRRRGRPLVNTGRNTRGQRIFERFGVPGLALQGPIGTGMYLAVLLGLSLGAPRRNIIVWALIGNAVWTIAMVVGTLAGVRVLT